MSAPYLATSTLQADTHQALLALETAWALTPTGPVDHPHFFTGRVARPEVMAAGLLTVADVAATRYLDLSALASRDPVVTASGDRLRMESFSACNGVQARFDLLPDGIESGEIGFGTTNVDVSDELRAALAAMPRTERMEVHVGADAVHVHTSAEALTQERVELPARWVRGFGEVPALTAQMRLVTQLRAPEAMAFLARLPRTSPGPSIGLARTPRGLEPVPASAATVTLAGTARLSALRRIMRHITSLDVYGHPSGASAWVAHLPGGRVSLAITAQPYRGFSGEGQLLADLTGATGSGGARLLEHLAWEPVIDPAWLAQAAAMTRPEVDAALAELAASGRVGYDLSESAWFHRELPHDPDAVGRDHPRLVKARELAAAARRDAEHWVVGEGGHTHWVTLEPEATCTCPWFTRYRGHRGPCSHVLAAQLAQRG